MQKYSIFNLIKNAFSGHQNWDLAWKDPTPKKEYDVVIIGGGWSWFSYCLLSCKRT
jgi:sarcosine oxidase subunit beta